MCCPQDTGCPTEPGVTTSIISDVPGYLILCETFVVFFIVNDPDNCSYDREVERIYENYVQDLDLSSSQNINCRKLTIEELNDFSSNIENLFTDEVNTIVNESQNKSFSSLLFRR